MYELYGYIYKKEYFLQERMTLSLALDPRAKRER